MYEIKSKELKALNPKDWICQICIQESLTRLSSNLKHEVNDLNESPEFKLSKTDFDKYDNMIFSPLRFDHETNGKAYNDVVRDDDVHQCSYLTPDQFRKNTNVKNCKTNCLNIRSLWKNFNSL